MALAGTMALRAAMQGVPAQAEREQVRVMQELLEVVVPQVGLREAADHQEDLRVVALVVAGLQEEAAVAGLQEVGAMQAHLMEEAVVETVVVTHPTLPEIMVPVDMGLGQDIAVLQPQMGTGKLLSLWDRRVFQVLGIVRQVGRVLGLGAVLPEEMMVLATPQTSQVTLVDPEVQAEEFLQFPTIVLADDLRD